MTMFASTDTFHAMLTARTVRHSTRLTRCGAAIASYKVQNIRWSWFNVTHHWNIFIISQFPTHCSGLAVHDIRLLH